MVDYDKFLRASPDPEAAQVRFDRLIQDETSRRLLEKLPESSLPTFFHLIALSNFIYRYFCRHPGSVAILSETQSLDRTRVGEITDLDRLRQFKYRELLRIAWMDLHEQYSYKVVLDRLSFLAEIIIDKVLQIVAGGKDYAAYDEGQIPFCTFAMGKLGAGELNFSSDVDLIFVCMDRDEYPDDYHEYQADVIDHIRQFSKAMQDVTEDGFLYRVDLKLRPWGRSGPLVLSVDETEHYYEASTEAWERFAWLRARIIAGDSKLGDDLTERLQSFIYLRSLSNDDLQRFVQIKNDMNRQRHKPGNWNVKLGDGGIRDIEFFIQMLQIVNAHSHKALKATNTLTVLDNLVKLGFISREEGKEISASYLFLRRLENRLQMIDERQTHQLPDEPGERRKVACSMGFGPAGEDKTVEEFDWQLLKHREIARSCFDRILPRET